MTACTALLLLSAMPVAATAQPARPWVQGVTATEQREAERLHKAGNELFRKGMLPQALVEYKKALKHWDHPRIHYQIALVLVQLGERPLDAYNSVKKALRYDGEALRPEQLVRARGHAQLLRDRLSELTIACAQSGVQVKLNGKPLIGGCGVGPKLLNPGKYEITARKKGYTVINQSIKLWPNQSRRVELRLFTLKDVSGTERYWTLWKPWAVFGAGITVAAIGGVLHWRGKSNIDKHDEILLSIPECSKGCKPGDGRSPDALLARGYTQQNAAIASYIIGGAAVTTGLILALVNRPRKYHIDLTEKSFRMTVLPGISPESISLSAVVSF